MCDCHRRLGEVSGCVVLVRCFGFRCHDAVFICVLVIQTSKIYSIRDKKSNQLLSNYYRIVIIATKVIIVISNV